MSLPILIANRLEKIIGTLIKAVAYIFHFLLPNKRFTIPLHRKSKTTSNRDTKIPKKIWQTNYTNRVSLPVYINYLFNRLMSLDYEYHYVSTEDRLVYIKNNAPKHILEAYEQLTDGASQADFWRLLVLDKEGGIYMDIDAHLVWPLSRMIQKDDTEVFLLNKAHYTNYFIATCPDNKILQKCIALITDNIQNKRFDRGVYALTGPGVLNIAIDKQEVNHRYYRLTCIQGSFTNEYFQYIDKPRGKWIHTKREELLKT